MKDYTHLDVIRAKLAGDLDGLTEASLSRVWQHTQKAGKTGFGIVSAYRGGNSQKENRALAKKLEADVRALGLGFFSLIGHWRECQNKEVDYASCPEDQLVDVVEYPVFVPGVSRKQIAQLGKKYDQDAVIYAGPDTEGVVFLIFRDGSTQKIGAFSPMKIAQAFSSLRKGRTFVFELKASCWTDAMIEQAHPELAQESTLARVRRKLREA